MQKTFSQIKPPKFKIEKDENGIANVLFFDNIEEFVGEDGIEYKYDIYTIKIQYRDNIEQIISDKYDFWLEYVKDVTGREEAKKIRAKRDKLLADTDWTQVHDTALSREQVEKYQEYRQKLRDITKQPGFPYNVEFPNV